MIGSNSDAGGGRGGCAKGSLLHSSHKDLVDSMVFTKLDYLIMSFGLVILFIFESHSILNSGHEFDDKVRGIILISEYLILTTLIIIFETADNTITDSNVYMMCGESQQCRT